MDFKDSHYIKEILDFHLPRFDELPNIDLYMDQVLSIIENSLSIFSSENEENIITKSMIFTIIGNALYITLILMLQSSTNILNVPEAKGETVMFGIFAFSALFNAFNCREFNFDSIIPNLTKNKLALQIIGITAVAQIFFTQIFRDFFNAVPLSVMEWIKIIALSFTVIIVDEVVKFVFRLFKKENKNDENMPKVEA